MTLTARLWIGYAASALASTLLYAAVYIAERRAEREHAAQERAAVAEWVRKYGPMARTRPCPNCAGEGWLTCHNPDCEQEHAEGCHQCPGCDGAGEV